jgi:glycosyltransferase involved in cell wall biosynthesis
VPEISIIIPTLNSASVLSGCLKSILDQTIPRTSYEIIVADAGSTDGTREMAAALGVDQIVENPLKTGEAGKAVGIAVSSGKFIALIDSDNLLESPDWLEKMVAPFADAEVMASEPIRFTVRPEDSALSRYFALLGANDPLCFFVGNYDRECAISGRWTGLAPRTEQKAGWLKVFLDEDHLPTIGANGFVFRRALLECVQWQPYYMDIDVVHQAMATGKGVVAKVDCGIVHLYCARLADFKRKQARRIRDFLFFSKQGERSYPWNRQRKWGIVRFCFETALVIPLLFQQVRGMKRQSDCAWWYHVPVCWITLWVYGTAALQRVFGKKATMYSREKWAQ